MRDYVFSDIQEKTLRCNNEDAAICGNVQM